jgi:hypothetical protein
MLGGAAAEGEGHQPRVLAALGWDGGDLRLRQVEVIAREQVEVRELSGVSVGVGWGAMHR